MRTFFGKPLGFIDNKNGTKRYGSVLMYSFNPILRRLQWFTKRPFVFAAIVELEDKPPKFLRHTFCRVTHNYTL